MFHSYMFYLYIALSIYVSTLYYSHPFYYLPVKRIDVIFCTHSPESYPIDMLHVLCTSVMISRSTNDNRLGVNVYSIFQFMANGVGPINNVSLIKLIDLAKSHSYMRIAILTKISYNDT